MILLRKDSNNSAFFRLGSKTTITGSSVFYLFKFTNPQTRQEVLFTGLDISPNKAVFNQFNIVETGETSVNLTASTVNLEPAGWWNYEAYQMTGQTNLLASNTIGGAIEKGKVLVTGTTLPHGQQHTYTGETTTRTVYYNN